MSSACWLLEKKKKLFTKCCWNGIWDITTIIDNMVVTANYYPVDNNSKNDNFPYLLSKTRLQT